MAVSLWRLAAAGHLWHRYEHRTHDRFDYRLGVHPLAPHLRESGSFTGANLLGQDLVTDRGPMERMANPVGDVVSCLPARKALRAADAGVAYSARPASL